MKATKYFFKRVYWDCEKEFRVSHNLRDTWPLFFARMFWLAVCLVKAFCIGINWTRSECLGSSVVYRGRKCFVSNWAGSHNPTLAGDGFYEQNCPREQIKNVMSLSEIWHRFTSGVMFYTGYHMDNDINKRLYPKAFARIGDDD